MPTFSDMEDAFAFVSMASYGMNSAVLRLDTGQILYQSAIGDEDEIGDGEDLDWDQCIEIPHKNDLGLGRDLVFEFVRQHLPDHYGRVRGFFHSRGAYARYKDLLVNEGLIQEWFDFQNTTEERAIRQWCEDNDVQLSG